MRPQHHQQQQQQPGGNGEDRIQDELLFPSRSLSLSFSFFFSFLLLLTFSQFLLCKQVSCGFCLFSSLLFVVSRLQIRALLVHLSLFILADTEQQLSDGVNKTEK